MHPVRPAGRGEGDMPGQAAQVPPSDPAVQSREGGDSTTRVPGSERAVPESELSVGWLVARIAGAMRNQEAYS